MGMYEYECNRNDSYVTRRIIPLRISVRKFGSPAVTQFIISKNEFIDVSTMQPAPVTCHKN
jgi:hypothetical protein